MKRRQLGCPVVLPALFLILTAFCLPLRAQTARPPSFLAEHYELAAYLDTTGQSINAVVKIDFRAVDVSTNLRVELHPNLDVREVKTADGKSLTFQRENESPLFVSVTLPAPVAVGKTVTLTFSYAGLLANEENSPVPNIRLASIGKDWVYLLLPSRWFPLTDYPANRYTGTFRLNVPDTMAMTGTGKADSPQPVAPRAPAEGNRLMYTFHCERAEPNGSFVAGPLQLNPKQAEGISVAVYAPRADSGKAQEFANIVAHQEIIFSDLFGPLPEPDIVVAELPDGTLREFSAPGVVMLGHHAWDPKYSDRTLSRLVAGQWWGSEVLPASTADVWISDGLARYSEELYAEQNFGKEAGLKAIDEFAVGALMFDDSAPVAQSARLVPYSAEYRSVVMNKGAMLFHMLRAQMGDVAFKSLLHAFYATYQGKTATMLAFESMAIATADAAAKRGEEPRNLQGYFSQWLNSTGIPEFTLEYVTYRTRKGFRIVGKIKQPQDTFAMPVQVRIDTEGNPELKTIDVVGTESDFTVETFGRPKSGGIRIDPNNLILKSSPSLRAGRDCARRRTRRNWQVLRCSAAVPASTQHPAQPRAGELPHGRGVFLPEELSGRGQRLSRSPGHGPGAFREVDGGVGPHLLGEDIRFAGTARARLERIQQGAANQRQCRGRAGRRGSTGEEGVHGKWHACGDAHGCEFHAGKGETRRYTRASLGRQTHVEEAESVGSTHGRVR